MWGLPPVFQDALHLQPHSVIEFMVPAFDRLPHEEQDRVIIHELLHIPRTFSGGIRPERSPSMGINPHTVERDYSQYPAPMRPTKKTEKGGRIWKAPPPPVWPANSPTPNPPP